MIIIESICLLVAACLCSPLLSGIILKTKAFFGGKKGPPVLIQYYTLIKLMKKGSVYSRSTTWLFSLGPIVSLCGSFISLLFLPIAGHVPVFSFYGDVIFILYILGLGRFFTISAAMDTASPFEGMGAAREAYFPIICEAASFMIYVLFYRLTGMLSLSAFFSGTQSLELWNLMGAPLLFIIISLFVILLTENSRVPVDDPATHLELTMIHEAMVLDHSGPDLALIELGSCLKLFFYSGLISRLIIPFDIYPIFSFVFYFAGLFIVSIMVGIIESVMARYRMDRVPQFVLTSFALAFFAIIMTLEFI